jgi:uncharacterized membrane protein YjgN (DUF898 family)
MDALGDRSVNQVSMVPRYPPPLPPPPLAFCGDRRKFFGLVARGAALELVTVGFYRFWLITDLRRHLWANTLIDGDGAEYTGRGRELLFGFLFALAILAPFWLGYFLVGIEAERYRAFASTPLVVGLYAFGQFAIFRARRYRLTRTVWRGVRFWMDGSGLSYALRAMGWGVLMVLTLGLILPWREAALERYKMRHSHYGDLQGRFVGKGWDFFKKAWWLWLLAPFALVLFPLAPFLYAEFKAIEWRWWISGIRFADVRLESNLRGGAFYGLYWKVIGWSLLLSIGLGFYIYAAITLVASISGLSFQQMIGPGGSFRAPLLVVLTAIGYVALVLAINVVTRLYLQRDVWARVSASITVHDIETAANVAARGDLASALGEGFADGLDVAGF